MEVASLHAAQKVDSSIMTIIDTAPAVAIYGFDYASKAWERSEHEGALLVCGRSKTPEICVVILNQLKPQNYIEYMEDDILLQRKDEYLLYKRPEAASVKAIWFYSELDCIRIFEKLNEVMAARKTTRAEKTARKAIPTVPAKPSGKDPVASPQKQGDKDIVKMLSKAQKEMASQGSTTLKASGEDPVKLQPGASAMAHLFKTFIPAMSDQRNDATGGSSVSQSGGNQNKESSQSSANIIISLTTQAAQQGVQGAYHGVPIGKGRGRSVPESEVPLVPAALRQLLVRPPSTIQGTQQQVQSAFSHVEPRPKTAMDASNDGLPMISNLRVENPSDAAIRGASLSPLLPSSVSPVPSSISAVREDLLTPADLAALNGRVAADRFRQATASAFVASQPVGGDAVHQGVFHGITPASTSLTVGQSVLSIEQFRQCFIYMLEHDNEFVNRLYDAFVRRANKGTGQYE